MAALPRNRVGDVLGRQVLKSGTSIDANYREALRASRLSGLIQECGELLAIFAKTTKSVRRNP